MPKLGLGALCLSLACASACAPKTLPSTPVVAWPRFPDFVAPVVPAAFAGSTLAAHEARGWTFVQAGDPRSAERELLAALNENPNFFPAETALGYVELARKDAKAALTHFDRTLKREPADASALVGRGQASLALNRDADALAAFKAALATDPSLVEIQRRVEVLQFRGLGQGLTAARAAARAGRLQEALAAYTTAIASSPDSAFLYREVAGVERQAGDADSAVQHLRKAVALDPNDAGSFEQLGELLEANADLDGAAAAYTAAFAIEPRSALQAKRDAVQARAELARLPAQYHAIAGEGQITRGDLAAVIGVRLAPLLQVSARRDPVLITDVRAHWAAGWIMAVTRAGVMEPFDNHAFQPRLVVRRVDLALALGRLLGRVAVQKPTRAKAWQTARPRFSDLAPGHLAYPAVAATVAAGVLTAGSDGRFQPTRPVSGEEAIAAVDRVGSLADVPPPAQVVR
jgi:tetratricopeptide (TPR) repeat protein